MAKIKKKIVWFLCELGLFRLAEFISPSLVGWWRGKKMAEGFARGMQQFAENVHSLAEALHEINVKKEITIESKAEHKCNGCQYKGEHQEMMFKPIGVCKKEIDLLKAIENYDAEKCPYDFLQKEMHI